MNREEIVIFLICLIYMMFIDFCIVFSMWKHWFVKKEILRIFPKWKGSKKILLWTIFWSTVVSLNLVFYLAISLIFKSKKIYGLCTIIGTIPYLIFVGFAYLITKWHMLDKMEKD